MRKIIKSVADALLRRAAQALPAWKDCTVLQTHQAQPPYQPVMPANLAALPPKYKQRFTELVPLPVHRIYRLRNVHVTWDGAVFHNLRLFVPSIVHPRFASRFRDTLLLRQWIGEQVSVPETCVAVCHDQWSVNNYYHWLIDTLPRLLVLRQAHPNMLLLLPQHRPRTQPREYIGRSAAALGFTEYQMLNDRQILRAGCVVLPELTAPSLTQNPELIRQVRSELLAALSPAPSRATRKVYAARAAQGVRRIVNEAELDAALQKNGFEKVHFDELSFLEQVELMRETAVLLGVHGAAMTNMLFLPEEAKVIELLNEECGELCYTRLASCLNLPYFFAPCVGTNPELGNQSDMVSDIAAIEKIIDAALS